MIKKCFCFLFIFFTFVSLNSFATELLVKDMDTQKNEKKEPEPKNTLYIELKDGIVIAELFPKIAPGHTQRVRSLTNDGFYDGLKFHRVIDGFMAQTGDPTGTGRGGSSYGKLYAEFSKEPHSKGTLSMARASDVNSANSQFFIVTGDYFPELDGQYTVFGRVIEGMEYVSKIKAGDTSNNGVVENPDVMVKVVSGDMLNNKSIETIKKEMKIINDMQDEKKKENPNYQKKPVLELLLETKDIDINKVEEQPAVPSTNTVPTPTTPTVPAAPTANTTPATSTSPNSTNQNQEIDIMNMDSTKTMDEQTKDILENYKNNTQKFEGKTTEEIKNTTVKDVDEKTKQLMNELGIEFDENATPKGYKPKN